MNHYFCLTNQPKSLKNGSPQTSPLTTRKRWTCHPNCQIFKTGKGEYGEGDIFIELSNPQVRTLVKEHWKSMDMTGIQELINDKIHELRFTGLLVLVAKFPKSSSFQQQEIINFYIKNVQQINNWDLVDCSSYKILGKFLMNQDRQIFYNLAESGHLWSERISVVSCLEFIRNG